MVRIWSFFVVVVTKFDPIFPGVDMYKVYPEQEDADEDYTSEEATPDEASTIQSKTEFVLYVTTSGTLVDTEPVDLDDDAESLASSISKASTIQETEEVNVKDVIIQTDPAAPRARRKCTAKREEADAQTDSNGTRKVKRDETGGETTEGEEEECDDEEEDEWFKRKREECGCPEDNGDENNSKNTQTEGTRRRRRGSSSCTCPCGGDETKSHLCTCNSNSEKAEVDTQTMTKTMSQSDEKKEEKTTASIQSDEKKTISTPGDEKKKEIVDLTKRKATETSQISKFLQWDWDNPCSCPEEFVGRRLKQLTWTQMIQYAQADGGEWSVDGGTSVTSGGLNRGGEVVVVQEDDVFFEPEEIPEVKEEDEKGEK